ncbi:hypothetical protein PIB30_052874 [Stylosanthes scabra]|uniref:Cytochrome P450 714A1-like n=1 Tax=Stylosanthes scabra TaxID=79078 RepID=A0ABU6WID6_9FABA|nr:hypothetical protein [Stylosanthes scabra]
MEEEVFVAMMKISLPVGIIIIIIVGGISIILMCVYGEEWSKSQRIRRKLRMQGIKGPPPSSFLHGNLPDINRINKSAHQQAEAVHTNSYDHHRHPHQELDFTASLFPYFEHWRKQYGLVYTYSTGMKQHLYVNQPELVTEMNKIMTLELGKPTHVTKNLAPLLGNGILRSNGLSWAHQRKLVAAEFFIDKVKGMVGLMIESAQPLLTKWEKLLEEEGAIAEIEVNKDLRILAADIISRVCFGHSYCKGKQVFSKLRFMQTTMSKHGTFLFGVKGLWDKLNFLKKKENEVSMKEMETEIESLIWELVEERKQECSEKHCLEKDLMQLLLEAAAIDEGLPKNSGKQFVVDNCKNIYFAGHETIAITASWCLMLLAKYPHWQTRVRDEIVEHFPTGIPDADSLPLLKTLNMVIQEVLRLYPPAAFVSREAYEDIQIGNLHVPKGVCLWTLIPAMNRDPDNWGPDANEFKPERFSEGLSKACTYPQAYVPFGLGPRLCLGKNFAIVQVKVVLALIISKFSFSLSPSYKHSPKYRMIIEPGYGVHILIRKI